MTGIVQASYNLNHGNAWAGMVADDQLANIVSKLNTDTATIAYGKGVVADGENGAKLPATGAVAANFVGVAVRELNRSYAAADTFGAPVKKDYSVMTVGVIWVKVLEAVAARDAAYLRIGSTSPGDFCKTAGTGATESIAIPGAKFLTAASAGGLAKISFVVGG